VAARAKRRAGRPAAGQSAETRERILRAARRCFAEKGYSRTRNREIAEAAGVTAPALYHYFDAKAELYTAAHDHGLETVLAAYRAAVARHARCVDQLCAVLEETLPLNRAHPGLAEFLALAPLEARRHPELEAPVQRGGAEVRALLGAVLRGGIARGELRPDLELDPAVDLLLAATFGVHCVFGPLARPAEHAAVLRAFQELLRGSLLTHESI
jgi:AcrR family transcriptional regulator